MPSLTSATETPLADTLAIDTTSDRHVTMDAERCGGRPTVDGSRIRVQDIVVWHERQGLSVDEIVQRYPQLSLAGIHAALSYYHDHREAIEQRMREDNQLVEEMKRLYPSKVSTAVSA